MHEQLYQIFFLVFSVLALINAVIVIFSKNPVRSALALVMTFVLTAGIWLLAQAEFLALILVLVYVGAVMTLFLFVVMMTDISTTQTQKKFIIAVPIFFIIAGLFAYLATMFFHSIESTVPVRTNISNVARLGEVLYTDYVYAFEIAAALLLVAIISAITLTYRGVKPGTKQQDVRSQIKTDSRTRVKLIKMSPVNKEK